MKKNTISLAVITKNEKKNMERLLSNVENIHEIIVVDSGSTDRTIDVCKKAGAKVYHQDWLGFVDQRKFAFEKCHCDWILSLDADEALSKNLITEIKDAVDKAGKNVNGFSMPRLSFYLGKWIRHGGWYPDRKIRLIRRGKARWQGKGLHEKLQVTGEIKKLENPILHYVYKDISSQIKTINNYSTTYAEYTGKKGHFFLILGFFHMAGKFFECYLWKMGFLDGLPGFIIAMNSSWYTFVKHAKAWEKSMVLEDRFHE